MLTAKGRNVTGYWRRGTYNGQLAYNRVQAHSRTDAPAPRGPTKKTVVDPKKHSKVANCALPKPRDALKAAQTAKPVEIKQKVTTVD